MKKLLLLAQCLCAALFVNAAILYWDGGGGDALWLTAANWKDDVLPAPGDEVILDNQFVTGSYTVHLPAGAIAVTIYSLAIRPMENQSIHLLIPATNTAAPALDITGNGDALVLNKGAVLKNSSGASSGSPIAIAGLFRINNGGHYIHATARSNATVVQKLSAVAGTEKGVFEFMPPVASYTLSLTGRTYGRLVLSLHPSLAAVTYSGNGSSSLTIQTDLVIRNGVTFSTGLSATMLIGGDLFTEAVSVFNLQNTGNNNTVSVKGNLLVQGMLTETNTGQPVLECAGTANQAVSIGGSIHNQVTLRVNNAASITLLHPLLIPYKLELTEGKINSSDNAMLIMADNAVWTGGHANSFVEGPMKKGGDDANFVFPIGKGSIFSGIGFQSVGMAMTDTFQAAYFRENPQSHYGNSCEAPIDHVSYVEYWQLKKTTGAPMESTVTIYFTPYSFVKNEHSLYIARYEAADNKWKNAGREMIAIAAGSTSYQQGSISTGSTVADGLFSLATSDPYTANPLLVGLINFTAQKSRNGQVLISWRMEATERVRVDVQKSENNQAFYTIGSQYCTPDNKNYTITDAFLVKGVTRYRLKFTGLDGAVNYSRIIVMNDTGNELLLTAVSPVTDGSHTPVTIVSERSGKMNLRITDAAGRIVKLIPCTINAGTTLLPVSVKNMRGLYQLSAVAGDGKTKTVKLLVR